MSLLTAYLLFIVLPVLFGFVGITGTLVLLAYLSERRRNPRRPQRPDGLEQVLRRWRSGSGISQGQAA